MLNLVCYGEERGGIVEQRGIGEENRKGKEKI
jgi:hypothetical protein